MSFFSRRDVLEALEAEQRGVIAHAYSLSEFLHVLLIATRHVGQRGYR